jgi:GT2 family glycosyltransferase
MRPEITVSVVSHRQNRMVNALLGDLHSFCAPRVVLTLTENVTDDVPLETMALNCSIENIKNASPKGFGANHNAAFTRCRTPFFCVVNPDVRLTADPFEPLLETAVGKNVGAVGPLVRSSAGNIEDSARHYPTLSSLLLKFFRAEVAPDYPTDVGPLDVDWVAGMFVLFRSDAFRAVGGFDERYFLYYEDIDLCLRLRAAGHRVLYDPRSEVIHDAQRASRRNPRRALHHIASAARFLMQR